MDLSRYERQFRLRSVGEDGQRRLAESTVLIAGCGALGSHGAMWLARAGVGHLILADRDLVDRANLHRQVLYDDDDADRLTAKARAASDHLSRANREVQCEAVVADLDRHRVPELVARADVVVDGSDNYELRLLLNEVCWDMGRPLVIGAAVETYGIQWTVIPGETPCYACLLEDLPAPGSIPTCCNTGVLATAPAMVAAVQVTEAIKILLGRTDLVRRTLLTLDPWRGQFREIQPRRRADCPVCVQGKRPWSSGEAEGEARVLCSGEGVQVPPPRPGIRLNLAAVAAELPGDSPRVLDPDFLRCDLDGCQVTLFRDGRALVRGTLDPLRARALVSRLWSRHASGLKDP